MIADPEYARIFTKARIIAWQYGWALSVHGSQTRDLDLLMVPWTEWAYEHDHVLREIARKNDLHRRHGEYTRKPHGRLSMSLYMPEFGDPRWIDVSIIPRPRVIREPEPYVK